MKYKALRKKDTKEFVILEFHTNFNCLLAVYTTEIPKLQPISASMDLLKEMYQTYDLNGYSFDDFEFVELELTETGEIGADIRNKLTPFKSLASILKKYLEMEEGEKKESIKEILNAEIKQSEISVKYLTDLL